MLYVREIGLVPCPVRAASRHCFKSAGPELWRLSVPQHSFNIPCTMDNADDFQRPCSFSVEDYVSLHGEAPNSFGQWFTRTSQFGVLCYQEEFLVDGVHETIRSGHIILGDVEPALVQVALRRRGEA